MDDNKQQLPTRDELADLMLSPFEQCLEAEGITEAFEAKRIKQELNAKQKKIIKVRGAVNVKSLGKGMRVRAVSGTLAYNKEGEQLFGDGETVIEWDEINWPVRQTARQDLDKIRGHLRPVRMEHLGKDGQPLKLVDKVVFEIVRAPEREDA